MGKKRWFQKWKNTWNLESGLKLGRNPKKPEEQERDWRRQGSERKQVFYILCEEVLGPMSPTS